MKKIKIMLLSLALFAVVGGALAFKAKFNQTWCVTNAYSDMGGPGGAVRFYCSYNNGIQIIFATCGGVSIQNVTTDLALVAVKKLCTTITNPTIPRCNKFCPVLTTTIIN